MSCGSINPTADQHHWVEVKCRPSNTSFVCDPSYDGGGLKPLKRSITAYTLKEGGDVCLYPNGQQLAFIAAPESSTL